MKRLILFIISALLLCGLLLAVVGCSGSETENPEETTAGNQETTTGGNEKTTTGGNEETTTGDNEETTTGGNEEGTTGDGEESTTGGDDTEPHVHAFGEWAIVIEATCTAEGKKERVCACGEKETEKIDMLAHTEEVLPAKAATCTATGLTEGKKCSVCGEILFAQTELPKAKHNYENNVCTICGKETSEGLEYTDDGNGGYEVSGIGTCTDLDIAIPREHNGKPVTGIGEGAFAYCNSLTSITIPDSVTSIGDYAFEDCSSLTSITIPDSVTSIGDYAFEDCSSLTSITIPDSVTSIGSSAFDDCYKLIEVYNLSSLTLTAGSKDNGYVGYYAKNVYTDTTVKSKLWTDENGYIFYEDDNICYLMGYTGNDTALTLPASCNGKNYEIYQYAFFNCESLTSITMGDGVTSIGKYAFYECSSLTSIVIGNSIASIGGRAFYYCYKLIEVYNLSSLTITAGSEDNGMVGCYAKNIYTDTTVKSKLWTDENGYIFYEDDNICYLMGYTGSDTALTLPADCNGKNYEIYLRAFCCCDSLTSIIISNSVTGIGNYAFFECSSLTSITIPNSVTSIGNGAFYWCSSLASITISDGVTSIGDEAFYDCYNLISITIPNSVTSIGEGAFSGCSKLTSITIPDSVTSIGDYAFCNCEKLTSITIPDRATLPSLHPQNNYCTL